MSRSLRRNIVSRNIQSFIHKIRGPKRVFNFPLGNLPPELLLEISAFLDCSALCSLRLTCKSIYDCTLPQFCKTYLQTVRTRVSLASLRRLETLLKNQRLCPHVRSLYIDGMDNDIGGWPTAKLTPQESIQRLQDTLLRLVNCQSFHLCPHFGEHYTLTPSDMIPVLFSVIAAIERPIRELSIWFKQQNETGRNRIVMSPADQGFLRDPKFITACSSLEALTFRFAKGTEDMVGFVIQLIQHAPCLQRLEIKAEYGVNPSMFTSRLLSTQFTLELRELSLEQTHVGSNHALSDFLACFKQSLVKISFWNISVDSGEWAPVLRLLSQFPSLTEISAAFLKEGYQFVHFPALLDDPIVDPVLGTKFSYTFRGFGRGPTTLEAVYSGPSMDVALQKLADFATPF